VMELKYFWWNPQWIYPDLVKSQWFLRSSSIFYLAVYPVDILMVQSQFLLKKKVDGYRTIFWATASLI
jgi:hypothetical protein